MAVARIKTSRTENALNLSGQLGPALTRHAIQRRRHLFLFLFAVDAACRLVDPQRNTVKPGDMIQEAATHQIDSGLRSTAATRDVFDASNLGVVNLSSTSFTKIDASHYCNLGLRAGPWGQLASTAHQSNNAVALEMIEAAQTYTGNTGWLPQQVNIGPDRIIDQLHYQIAREIFADGKPVFSLGRAKDYADRADRKILEYKVSHLSEPGMAACCDRYLEAYRSPESESKAIDIRDNIIADCQGNKLPVGDYVA
jgi:hypothetical protein